MKKRALELLAVVALVAAVVGVSRTTSDKPPELVTASYTTRADAADFERPVSKTPTDQATVQDYSKAKIWQSQMREAQGLLGQGANDKAQAVLLQALDSAPKAGPAALHQTLDELGLVCYRQADYKRSADFQAQAIEAAQTGRDQDAGTVGLYETRYALTLQALDQREEALAALGRAKEQYEIAYPVGSPAYSEAINGLAAQHRSLGDNDGAARLMEE